MFSLREAWMRSLAAATGAWTSLSAVHDSEADDSNYTAALDGRSRTNNREHWWQRNRTSSHRNNHTT